MHDMWRVILREIVIFIGCLLLFPAALLILLAVVDSPEAARRFVARVIFSVEVVGPAGTFLVLGIKLIAPYLIVQAIRGYLWSQRSLTGRKWANLYFSLLLAAAGVWGFWKAWDLFYFMTAMGDMPAELGQFIELSGTDILVFIFCSLVSIHCFRVFLNPDRPAGGPKRPI